MDLGFFCLQKERIFPGVHKIGASISVPRIADKNFTDTRIFLKCKRRGRSTGPAPSSSAPLETALRQSRNAVVSLLVHRAFVFGFLFWIGVLSLVMQHLLAVLFVTQGRLRAGPYLLGSQCFVWHLCVVIAPLGAYP